MDQPKSLKTVACSATVQERDNDTWNYTWRNAGGLIFLQVVIDSMPPPPNTLVFRTCSLSVPNPSVSTGGFLGNLFRQFGAAELPNNPSRGGSAASTWCR